MFVSHILRLRQPTRTLRVRLFASKSTAATPIAVPEQTSPTGTPQTGGEQPAHNPPPPPPTTQQPKKSRSSRPSRRRRAVLLRSEHRPRRTELPQGPAPRGLPSRRGVSAVVMEVARQVRVAG